MRKHYATVIERDRTVTLYLAVVIVYHVAVTVIVCGRRYLYRLQSSITNSALQETLAVKLE